MHGNVALLPNNPDVWFESTECDKFFSQQDTVYYLGKMKDERRTDIRFNVIEGMYAVIDSLAPQICQILNISSGGMAFVYFANDGDPELNHNKLDVVVKCSGFCLENIFFEKVAEYKVMGKDSSGMEKRIINIKFTDLDEIKIAEIKAFIRNFINKTVN